MLTLFPFLGLLYLLLAQVAATDPRFLRQSRVNPQDSLGLTSNVVSKQYSAEGTASLRAILTLVGLLGLSYAGIAWIDTIRHGLRSVWPEDRVRPWWLRTLSQWLSLLAALPSVVVVVCLAAFVGPSPYRLLATDGLRLTRFGRLGLELLALVAVVAWASLLSYVAYRRLGGAPPTRGVRWTAVVSGAGLSLMAAVAMVLLPVALSDPYGIVVVILALMLWVSASVRIMLAMAVWSATT